MDKDAVIAVLRAHELELKASGVVGLCVFGSIARGDAGPDSDVDLLVKLSEDAASEGFAWFGRIDALSHRLQEILGRPVDIVTEPVRRVRLRHTIEKEQARAF
jgi:predicted nucleotidyltransferase